MNRRRSLLRGAWSGPGAWLLAALVFPFAAAAAALAQGTLAPPPGPPAPTQRSLAEIDERLRQLHEETASLGQLLDLSLEARRREFQVAMGGRLGWLTQTLGAGDIYLGLQPTWRIDLAYSPAARRPHVAWSLPSGVYLAEAQASGWAPAERIAGGAIEVHLAVRPDGQPVLAFTRENRGWWTEKAPSGAWISNAFTPREATSRVRGLEIDAGGRGWQLVEQPSGLIVYRRDPAGSWVNVAQLALPAVRRTSALALRPTGEPLVAYSLEGLGTFVARPAAPEWISAPVDTGPGRFANAIALAFSPTGEAALAYTVENGVLSYAISTPSGWVRQESTGVGPPPALAFLPDGKPAVAVALPGGPLLLRPGPGEWSAESTSPGLGAGWPDLIVDPAGVPWLAVLDIVDGPHVRWRGLFVPGS